MDYSMENLKIATAPYFRSYLPNGELSYMPVVFCDEYFVDCYVHPQNFMISNYGRLYSKLIKKLIPIRYFDNFGNPYYSIFVIKNNSRCRDNVYVSELVARTFVKNENPSIFTMIHHKDTNLNNNYYLNLQWVDPNNIPQPNYNYDRSEAVKYVNPKEPSIFDYTQFKYQTARSITGKEVVVFVDEYFKQIKNHPKYFVSNYGRVYSDYKKCILTPYMDKDGYYRVFLDGINCGLHRIVAFTFYDPSTPNYGDQVNHKDGNKRNNHINNLEWCTCKENIHHAIKLGLRNDFGENNYWATRSNESIEKECQLLEQGYTAPEIANILGIEYSDNYSNHIGKIRRKEKWRFISDKYNIPRYSKNSYKYNKDN